MAHKKVAVVGATGYTGHELLRLLGGHPSVRATVVMTARPDHDPPPPELPVDPIVTRLDPDAFGAVDGVFLCTPHGAATDLARLAVAAGAKVVDLSADFRLRDPDLYARVYGQPHGAPELLGAAVYGLTEHQRARVASARLVANPGCYPTCVLLAVKPLLDEGLVEPDLVADCKSGVSGAGKKPTDRTIYGAVAENFLAYGVGNHRHLPEICQEAGTDRIVFVPHLLPMFRGMLGTIYLTPRGGTTADQIRSCLADRYADERFVRVFDRGQPELNRVQHTNYCDLAVAQVGNRVVVTSAIDNLGKGASGQAIQNMNLMLGLPEEEGLP